MDVQPIVSWMAPIASTVIVTAITAQINAKIDEDRSKTDAKRKAEAEWRDSIDARLDKQDELIDTILAAQCSQMRSDLIHRAHRYIDDLGCAGTEEKQSFWAEYEDYMHICDANNVVNHFIDNLAKQVMTLPNRGENQ